MSSSPSNSNSNKTFTVTPSSNLSRNSTYKIRLTTGIQDSSGNTLKEQWTMGNGFSTETIKFIIVGDLNILTSPDGITWKYRDSGGSNNWGITYGNNLFVLSNLGSGLIMTSPNGITWTQRRSGSGLGKIIYGNGLFVTVGKEGTILTSSDGISWTARTSGTSNRLYGVTYSQ